MSDLLKYYLNVLESTEVADDTIDGPNFDVAAYVDGVMETKSLVEIVDTSRRLNVELAQLEATLHTIVRSNCSKLMLNTRSMDSVRAVTDRLRGDLQGTVDSYARQAAVAREVSCALDASRVAALDAIQRKKALEQYRRFSTAHELIDNCVQNANYSEVFALSCEYASILEEVSACYDACTLRRHYQRFMCAYTRAVLGALLDLALGGTDVALEFLVRLFAHDLDLCLVLVYHAVLLRVLTVARPEDVGRLSTLLHKVSSLNAFSFRVLGVVFASAAFVELVSDRVGAVLAALVADLAGPAGPAGLAGLAAAEPGGAAHTAAVERATSLLQSIAEIQTLLTDLYQSGAGNMYAGGDRFRARLQRVMDDTLETLDRLADGEPRALEDAFAGQFTPATICIVAEGQPASAGFSPAARALAEAAPRHPSPTSLGASLVVALALSFPDALSLRAEDLPSDDAEQGVHATWAAHLVAAYRRFAAAAAATAPATATASTGERHAASVLARLDAGRRHYEHALEHQMAAAIALLPQAPIRALVGTGLEKLNANIRFTVRGCTSIRRSFENASDASALSLLTAAVSDTLGALYAGLARTLPRQWFAALRTASLASILRRLFTDVLFGALAYVAADGGSSGGSSGSGGSGGTCFVSAALLAEFIVRFVLNSAGALGSVSPRHGPQRTGLDGLTRDEAADAFRYMLEVVQKAFLFCLDVGAAYSDALVERFQALLREKAAAKATNYLPVNAILDDKGVSPERRVDAVHSLFANAVRIITAYTRYDDQMRYRNPLGGAAADLFGAADACVLASFFRDVYVDELYLSSLSTRVLPTYYACLEPLARVPGLADVFRHAGRPDQRIGGMGGVGGAGGGEDDTPLRGYGDGKDNLRPAHIVYIVLRQLGGVLEHIGKCFTDVQVGLLPAADRLCISRLACVVIAGVTALYTVGDDCDCTALSAGCRRLWHAVDLRSATNEPRDLVEAFAALYSEGLADPSSEPATPATPAAVAATAPSPQV